MTKIGLSSNSANKTNTSNTTNTANTTNSTNQSNISKNPNNTQITESKFISESDKINKSDTKALNFLEIVNSSNTMNHDENFAVSLKVSKSRTQGLKHDKISDYIKINIGNTRFNITDEYLTRYLKFATYFWSSLSNYFLPKSNTYSSNDNEELYLMRKYIYEKTKDETIQTDIMELKEYVKKELDRWHDVGASEGKFNVNLFFNELNFKEYEVYVNFKEILLTSIGDNMKTQVKNSTSLCKARIPDVDLKMIMNPSKLYSKIYDLELEYYKLSKWRSFINNVTYNLERKFLSYQGVEPFLKRHITEDKFLDFKKLLDMYPVEQHEDNCTTERQNFNNFDLMHNNNNNDSDDNIKTKRVNAKEDQKMRNLFNNSPETDKFEDDVFCSEDI